MVRTHSSLREGAGTAGEPPVAFAVTEGASGGKADGLLWGWYLLITTDTLFQFYQAASFHGQRKWDSFGEVPTLAIQPAMLPLAPSGLGLRPKPPPSRREV